mgnify:CR=1 FL=1
MIRHCVMLCVLCCLPVNLSADDKPKPKPKPENKKFKTSKEKASYGLGFDIGSSLMRQGIELDLDIVLQGLKDAFAEKDSQITLKEINAAFQEVRAAAEKKLEAKRKILAAKNKKEGAAFLAENKKKKGVVTLESGLQYLVLKSGTGKSPKATDVVKTHYHGTLIDGTVFDSSVKRGKPATFPVNRVIKGWTEALQKMKVGDKWKLFVPSELAYGEQQRSREIGPNSVLIFEVELLGIVTEKK